MVYCYHRLKTSCNFVVVIWLKFVLGDEDVKQL